MNALNYYKSKSMKYKEGGYNRLFAGELFSWSGFEDLMKEEQYSNQEMVKKS